MLLLLAFSSLLKINQDRLRRKSSGGQMDPRLKTAGSFRERGGRMTPTAQSGESQWDRCEAKRSCVCYQRYRLACGLQHKAADQYCCSAPSRWPGTERGRQGGRGRACASSASDRGAVKAAHSCRRTLLPKTTPCMWSRLGLFLFCHS